MMKLRLTFSILAAAIFIDGCGGAGISPNTPMASGLSSAAQPAHSTTVPDLFRKGLYVSDGTAIYGYAVKKQNVRGPKCTIKGTSYFSAVAVDGAGNLLVPEGTSKAVTIFKGPKMCGPELGSFSDSYGQPSDASSSNAATEVIAVANIFDVSGPGSISVCRLSGGCTTNLTNPNMYEVAGVALARNGDCWASAANSVGTATLTFFKGCAGAGQAATGYKNTYYGGLDIDIHGNLVAADAFTPAIWVYKGCNPKCSVVGGPLALHGDSVFCHLNQNSTLFAAADYQNGGVDIYAYSPTKIKYEFSFNNGLSVSDDVFGVAFNPRSKE